MMFLCFPPPDSVDQLGGSSAGFTAGQSHDCFQLGRAGLAGSPNTALLLVWQLLLAGSWALVLLPVATHPPSGWTGFLVVSPESKKGSRGLMRPWHRLPTALVSRILLVKPRITHTQIQRMGKNGGVFHQIQTG